MFLFPMNLYLLESNENIENIHFHLIDLMFLAIFTALEPELSFVFKKGKFN